MNHDVQGTLREIAERTTELRAGLADLAIVLDRASAAHAHDAFQRDERVRVVSAYVAELEQRALAQAAGHAARRRA